MKWNKRILALALALTLLLGLSVTALAAEETTGFTLQVGTEGTAVSLDDLPVQPYWEGETLMVPLRKIGEALGYRVDWDPETGAITLDDETVQKVTLLDGSAKAVFTGELKVINMSREVELTAPVTVHSGYTFVPLALFEEFFNDVSQENGVISVAPRMSELQQG